ncbi:hypothetical protein BGZ80_011649 [Entomortierella chlamydospora]|uniref:Uncharacterized protein n=1 Tax=Entomortierella chlamydospora TaxID=101097 RepID=A0A9P6MTK0_9FUNG|nr:hypothetical protein BGZ79_009315 [Entomortierella chlamydospora]KAG0012579.1 hypothetical protein BGZ80_011649 [Entomortierella chlamydospora]
MSNPLQTLNSSLKRIRLNETANELVTSRSDSFDQEWGNLDVAELDENDLATDSESPSTKKARKEDGDVEQEDAEDLDDFMPENNRSTSKTSLDEGKEAQIEKETSDRSTVSLTSLSSTSSTLNKTQFIQRSKPTKISKPTRTHNGMEDVFSHEQVRNWSEVRIKTWENRRTNTEGFYYRFVDPTEGQQNGPWSQKSAREFMVRLEEWKARGIRIGTSWGIFSMEVSHKAGYQCSSYYRKLLETKKLTDPSYAWENGKLIMVNKSSGGEMAISGLSERWDTDEVKEIEANINRWIKEYHSKPGGRPAASKPKRTDSIASAFGSNAATSRSVASTFRPTAEAPRVKATTLPAVPKTLSLRPTRQQLPDENEIIPVIDINDKLAEYSSFMKKSSSTSSEPDRIRQTISLTVAGTITSTSKSPARGTVPIEVRKAPLATHTIKGQTGLSLFWKNIRPVRVECPDVPRIIIPKDVELRPTWAHRIQPYSEFNAAPVEGSVFKEVPKMIDFDWGSLSEGFEEPIADIQGVLADPPWNFIVEDGRNDGACRLTTQEFGDIMEKALELMPNGIVSVWTHKAILPEVVTIMHGLGCRYVENLVWYKIALNNTNLDRASPYFRSSKEILLMFKKGDGFDIRHQRTADVIMDFEKPTSSWIKEDYTEPKPEGAFEMMEILLPDARYTPETGRGRLLELWAKKSQERRPGWLSVHELKCEPTTTVDSPKSSGSGKRDSDGDSIDEALLAEIANDMDLDQ